MKIGAAMQELTAFSGSVEILQNFMLEGGLQGLKAWLTEQPKASKMQGKKV